MNINIFNFDDNLELSSINKKLLKTHEEIITLI